MEQGRWKEEVFEGQDEDERGEKERKPVKSKTIQETVRPSQLLWMGIVRNLSSLFGYR